MTATPDDLQSSVAVVGMSARIPGAADLEEFWAALLAGRDLTTRGDGGAYGLVTDTEWFDAAFFGIPAQEAQLLDPQQRVFLECAWEALEDAGYDPRSHPGAIGVYAGSGETDHLAALRARRHLLPGTTDAGLRLAASRDALTGRTAYFLDLRGPAVTVHTACSTSLVAVHTASQALLAGDTDLALAGGITLRGAPEAPSDDDLLSPSGRCRPFDAGADGMVDADGAGVVVLKRLLEALDDGDHVHAVLRGSALSNDGAGKVGFTAPSVAGQVAAIRAAHLLADVHPDTVDHVEAHATGTAIGDAMEVRALTEAFGTRASGTCVLGALKSNIGHADAAAGVLGLIKVMLSLRHRTIPGTAHFDRPGPHLDLPAGRFAVTKEARPWPSEGRPRRAGVNSTGIGGTNVHVVVEEAPDRPPGEADGRRHLLPLSARTGPGLARSAERLRDRIQRDDPAIADVAWTLQVGRAALGHRGFVVCRDRDEAVRELTALVARAQSRGHDEDPAAPVSPTAGAGRVAFLFSGDTARPVGGARELYAGEPVFRAAVDDCVAQADPDLGSALVRALDPESGRTPTAAAASRFALFAVQHAATELWVSRGVDPHVVVGDGAGAHAAAVAAGVLTRAEALSLVLAEGRILGGVLDGAGLTDGDVEQYAAVLASVRWQPPRLPWLPGRTGTPLTAREVCGRDHWVANLRRGVGAGVGATVAAVPTDCADVVLDLGPGAGGAARSLHAVGELWCAGAPVRWAALHRGRPPRRVPLPTHPFRRERFSLPETTPRPDTTPPGRSERTVAVPDAGRAAVAPRTAVERAVAAVWCDVLGVAQVGIDDDFFDLGGHSLHATRMVSRLRSALGREASELTVLDVFDHSTVRELAATVDGHDPRGGAAP